MKSNRLLALTILFVALGILGIYASHYHFSVATYDHWTRGINEGVTAAITIILWMGAIVTSGMNFDR